MGVENPEVGNAQNNPDYNVNKGFLHVSFSADEVNDPILKENKDRFSLFPTCPEVYQAYKDAVGAQWTTAEVNLMPDIKHWNDRLNDDERHFIKHVLAFFAASDGIVNENLAMRFYNEVQVPEVRAFYGIQIAVETIHSEMYALLISTYINDPEERVRLFRATTTIPCIKKKAEWAMKWITGAQSFKERLIAFAIVEGIFFSGSFCSIFWLNTQGKLPGLCTANKWINRDENSHCRFASMLYKMLESKLPTERIHEILKEAVEIEKEFVCDALPVKLVGMNADLMCQYIESCADRLCDGLGIPALYGSQNPFPWMDNMGLAGKTNFFEKTSTEYSALNDNARGEKPCDPFGGVYQPETLTNIPQPVNINSQKLANSAASAAATIATATMIDTFSKAIQVF